MYNNDELEKLGVDTKDALARFMGMQSLFEKMLKKLPPAVNDNPVMEYFEKGDYETAEKNAHTLKGVTGNLSVTPLYKAYTEIVDDLRAGDPDHAKGVLADILPKQEEILSYLNDNA